VPEGDGFQHERDAKRAERGVTVGQGSSVTPGEGSAVAVADSMLSDIGVLDERQSVVWPMVSAPWSRPRTSRAAHEICELRRYSVNAAERPRAIRHTTDLGS